MMYKRKDNEYFLYVKTEQSFFLKMKFSLTVCLKCINCMTVQRGHTILRLFLLTLPDKTCFYEKWEMRVYSCITYKLSQRIFLNWKTWGTKRKKNVCFFPVHDKFVPKALSALPPTLHWSTLQNVLSASPLLLKWVVRCGVGGEVLG